MQTARTQTLPCPFLCATVQAVPGLVTPNLPNAIDGIAMAREGMWEDITKLWKIIG